MTLPQLQPWCKSWLNFSDEDLENLSEHCPKVRYVATLIIGKPKTINYLESQGLVLGDFSSSSVPAAALLRSSKTQ